MNHLRNLVSEDGFCSFVLDFKTVGEVQTLLQAVLAIQHERTISLHLRMENTSMHVRIEHTAETNYETVYEVIHKILLEEKKVKKKHGKIH